MHLIAILIALGLLQIWGARNPLHQDKWFVGWTTWLSRWPQVQNHPLLHLTLALAIPSMGMIWLSQALPGGFWLALASVVLLYSFGRGEFAGYVDAYNRACVENAWEEALSRARQQGINTDQVTTGDWPLLNQSVLETTAYQGFERMFAVVFWFALFGPAGAWLYRLSFLYRQNNDSGAAARWLWAMEWPAARVLGASFAITGNFVGCVNRWKAYAFSVVSPTSEILRECVLGALSVDDELVQSCDCTQREIAALKRLLTRTLWFWVTCLAIMTILY